MGNNKLEANNQLILDNIINYKKYKIKSKSNKKS